MIAYLVIRFVVRLFFTPKPPPQSHTRNPEPRSHNSPESLEKPRFTIEAESVDYEIIEEPEDKNEK